MRRDAVNVGVIPPPANLITGTSGVWSNVTPGGLSLVGADNGGDNYGVQDPLADPLVPARFYAFTCYNGVWESTDYGLTWAKVSTDGKTETGKCWGSGIAPDGSYMLCTIGNSATYPTHMLRSTDRGRTWTASASLGANPYNAMVSPYDATRAVCAFHETNHVFESLDSGVTWTDMGSVNAAITQSGYVFYVQNSDTLIYIGGDTDPSYRGTKSGGTWTWTLITALNLAGHQHGSCQLFYDATNSAVFHAAGSNNSHDGIYKSTDNGVTFTNVGFTTVEASIVGTASTLYAMWAAPLNTGSVDPKFTTAPRNPGTSWATTTSPGMVNGAKRMAVGTDGSRWVVLAGCWHGGIWRYVE